MIGKKISHYSVTEMLGKGGMGEVYRATDTKLGRDVALKVLPPIFANDTQRMARFKREAQLLASLNHSNIASIFGLEEGESDGARCLVLELVEGPTLAERIAQGAIPLEEALNIAKQIAEALESAHEKGIIHRDLKPSNVKVTPDGMVKVLDFGLAKALDAPETDEEIANSPTLSAMATQAGVILGTAAYMSPEQAKGKAVDKRADIWSFGVVLFEMLTGKRLYTGETPSEIRAAVIKDEPDWDSLHAETPVPIQKLLRRCLEKNPKRRLRDIGEARIALEEYLADPAATSMVMSVASTAPEPVWRRALPWAVACVLAVVTALALWPEPAPLPMHLSVEVAPGMSLLTRRGGGAAAIVSPDGTRLAFVATDPEGQRKLYVRSLDQLQAAGLSGTEGAANPFFSPDGGWVGFFAGGMLKKVSVKGGAVVPLCDAPTGRGGSWSEDGTIVFAPDLTTALSRVSSAGGIPETLTKKEEGDYSHRWPQLLPGGKAVLFTVMPQRELLNEPNFAVHVLETGERKILEGRGNYVRYVPTGFLVYEREETLFAAPFDAGGLEVTGPPVPILENLRPSLTFGSGQFDFSQSGTLVYLPADESAGESSIFWMNREGKREPLLSTPRDYGNLRFSPDGRRLAMIIRVEGSGSDIWVYEWEQDILTRLTFDVGQDYRPWWTPDGKRVTFASNRNGGVPNIYWKRADGAGEAERLTESDKPQFPHSWSPDGKVLAFVEISPETSRDIWTLQVDRDEAGNLKPGKPEPFLRTPFLDRTPRFSPDGGWLTYVSNESGTNEVYVRPFPGPGGKWQISSGGGNLPVWSSNGRELFYRVLGNPVRIMVVSYTFEGDSFHSGRPRQWSEVEIWGQGSGRSFALHPDGERFAVIGPAEGTQSPNITHVNLVFNWFDEVRRRVASAGQN